MQFDSNMESDFEASSFLRGSSRNPLLGGSPPVYSLYLVTHCAATLDTSSFACLSGQRYDAIFDWRRQRRTNERKAAWVLGTGAPRWGTGGQV